MSERDPTSGVAAAGVPPGRRSPRRLWTRAWAVSAASVVFGSLYFFVRQYLKDGIWRFDLTLVDKALGVTALFLVTLSMALTGVASFSKRSGRSLAARKYYGLVGFWTGLAHAAVNHFGLAAVGLRAESGTDNLHAEAAGLAALALFGLMAAGSNSRVAAKLGPERWRRSLRYAGYIGLVIAAGHAALLKWASWTKYVRTFSSVLPSLSLPAALFAVLTVLLRLAVGMARRRKKT
jgi:hypothetical protein